ncbi:hypothetical protein PMZ80_001998 [Knufia obscura]|uniref:N-acetyltransferase domain-containing protein n=1 Tax=Knufia obscura TaxID=1635080 RepID=A0ABR0RWY2_9EURO|nr:hypothetical protein PMZ80_001998 [Knufia obscura]
MPLAERNNLVLDYLQPQDVEAVGSLFLSSFHVYPFFQKMMPDSLQTIRAWSAATNFAIDDPNTLCLKVTDTSTGTIAAHGRWIRPKGEGERGQPGHEEERWGDTFMEACDEKLAGELFGAFDRNREKFMGQERHWYMELLLTHPDYQGKGCASMILRHGLELADREQLPCYIDSSPMGKAVYEKMGWKLEHKEDFEHGLSYYFGVRQPQSACSSGHVHESGSATKTQQHLLS